MARLEDGALATTSQAADATADRIHQDFLSFLESFTEPSASRGDTTSQPFYVTLAFQMYQASSNTLYVDFNHLFSHSPILANAIREAFPRFEGCLKLAVNRFISATLPDFYQSLTAASKARPFFVAFYGHPLPCLSIRSLQASHCGQLVRVRVQVTRTSQVRPELLVGSFQCLLCGANLPSVQQQAKFTEPKTCTNATCSNQKAFRLLPESSEFCDWQRLRCQELPSEIPPGNMPRSLEAVVRGSDQVERSKPGDTVELSGLLIVVPEQNQSSLTITATEGSDATGSSAEGLSYRLVFLSQFIGTSQTADGSMLNPYAPPSCSSAASTFDSDHLVEAEAMRSDPALYANLVSSFAPHIYGNSDVKAGCLLQLFGGVPKATRDGSVPLRGDINVCVVGDPGTAKSQLLRYVSSLLPRAVYASGRGSSAAGLTASVLRDAETGDLGIEAGALMLADGGVCAIDEFEKMNPVDQVAIHEAMEQQTISIAKAGIQATLSARTCVLAAANPVGGRYDRSRTLRQNVALSAAILSRFDLLFVLIDDSSEEADFHVARHVLSLHSSRGVVSRATAVKYEEEQLKRYLKFTRASVHPRLGKEAAELLVQRYVQLRTTDAGNNGTWSHRMTVRQLESLIRLSEALARLHCDLVVQPKYVAEAARLLKGSILRLEEQPVQLASSLAVQSESSTGPAGASAPLFLPAEEFSRITGALVHLVNTATISSVTGVLVSAIVDRWLEANESSISSEVEYFAAKSLVTAVIERLVEEGILLRLGESADDLMNTLVVVHPNYNLE